MAAAREVQAGGEALGAVVVVGAFPGSAGSRRQAYTAYARRSNQGSAAAAVTAESSSPSHTENSNRQLNAAVGDGVGADLLAAAVTAEGADGERRAAGDSALDGGDGGDAGDEDYDREAEERDSSTAPSNGVNIPTPSAPRTKGKAPVVVRLDVLVPVPAMEERVFATWEHFHAYLQDYGQKTFQLYSVRSATPSSRRNNLVNKKKAPHLHQLIPEQFVHYVKTITCTHGGKPRPRSTGVRPNHQHRAIECPAQINACVKRDPHGIWRVVVTNQSSWHNHEISDAIYNGYPEVRNALGADVLATVNILRKAEAKRKKILEYIVENTPKKPRMKDVHNLLSKMKKKDTAISL